MMIKKLAIAGVAAMSVAGVQLAQAKAGETCTGGIDQIMLPLLRHNLPSDIPYDCRCRCIRGEQFCFFRFLQCSADRSRKRSGSCRWRGIQQGPHALQRLKQRGFGDRLWRGDNGQRDSGGP